MSPGDDQRVGVAIAAGLLAEGFSFSTRSSAGPDGSGVRFWELRLNPNGMEGVAEEITVKLVGAFGVLASSSAIKLLHPTLELYGRLAEALGTTIPFARLVGPLEPEGVLWFRAEFPLDPEADPPISPASVRAAVHGVASAMIMALSRFPGEVEQVDPGHVPGFGWRVVGSLDADDMPAATPDERRPTAE